MKMNPIVIAALLVTQTLSACSNSEGPGEEEKPQLTGRRGYSIAYDETAQRVILFGGQGTEGGSAVTDQNSTWALNGTTWTRLATTGPSPRNNASMVWDATKKVIVLYGGRSGTFPNEVVYTDTWEWNGTSWTQRATTGPGARVHQTMAYDRTRGRAVLFGGFNMSTQQELRDVWEWDGTSWSQKTATVSGTFARGTAFDEKTNTFYLFSADAGGTVRADTWNGTSATARPEVLPSCLAGAIGLGATRGGLFAAEYCASASAIQSYRFTNGAWSTLTGTQPTVARLNYSIVYDRTGDRVILFGGESLQGGVLGDTWSWDGTTWTRIAG